MKQATVVGIGSPFGADQLGWQIIEELRQHPKLKTWPDEQVQLLYRDRPGVSLIQDLKNSQYAILIDAVDDAAHPGKVTRLDKSQLLSTDNNFSTHALGVNEALALGQAINALPDILILYGLSVAIDDMTMPGDAEIQEMVMCVIDEIDSYFADTH